MQLRHPVTGPSAIVGVLDAAPVAAALVDGAGRVLHANAALVPLLDPSGEDDLAGRLSLDVDSAGRLRAAFAEADEHVTQLSLSSDAESPRFTARVVASSGTACVVYLCEDPGARQDGQRERQELIERLLALEARYRAHFDFAPVGLFEADAESGRLLAVNATIERLTGFSQDDLLGIRLRHLTHPEHRARDRGLLSRAIDERAALVIEETRWLTRQGEAVWVRIDGALLEAGDGSRLVAVVQDIAERRRQRDALETVASDRDKFLAMLGHQLRNRLAAITTACQLIELNGSSDPAIERAQGVILRQSQSMARFLDSLQDVVRIAGRQLNLSLQPMDVVRLVDEVTEEWQPRIEAEHLDLEVELPGEPLWIRGDRDRLQELLDHLLSNALRFTKAPGTIQVKVASDDEGRVRISTRDTGRGFEPSQQLTAFEPFRNISRRLDRAASGLGLGLPFARGIAELHGGALHLWSEGRDRGSELVVTLPLHQVPTSARPSAPSEHGARGQRVLLVEDDRDTAESTRELLTLAGHEVAVATDGGEALHMAAELEPDVVLCDIALRGERNGYDVARALRRRGRPMQLVAVTGYSRQEDRDRAHRAGFDMFLVKPIKLEDLDPLLDTPPLPSSSRRGARARM